MRTPAGTGPPADQTAQARAAPPSARERFGEHEPRRTARNPVANQKRPGCGVGSRSAFSTGDGGEPSSSGPVRGKGGVRSREPLPRHTGGDPEPCKPVHEPTTDSRSGEGKTRNGAHHGHLRGFLDRRVTDDVIRRMIDKSRIVHRYVAGSEALS